MTVCIAAVCNVGQDGGAAIVAASDRMITIGELEYEPDQTKLVYLAERTIALLAGDMELHASVIPIVLEKIKNHVIEHSNINVITIAEFYAEEFAFYRRAMAEREILVPRGLDFERFYNRQIVMAHYQVRELDSLLSSYYANSSAIITGIDSGAHIYKIENPGVAKCWDTPFFACIGNGEAVASTQFMVAGFEKRWPLAKTAWLAFSAKAKAEAAGGVGRKTDLIIIKSVKNKDGRYIEHVTDYEKNILYDIFDKTTKKDTVAAERAVIDVQLSIPWLAHQEQEEVTNQQDVGSTS